MPEPCDRRDTQWIKELILAHDRRYEAIFMAQEKATEKQERNAEHWRAQANEWRQAMTDREREFTPKMLFYIMWAGSFGVSLLAVLLSIYGALK